MITIVIKFKMYLESIYYSWRLNNAGFKPTYMHIFLNWTTQFTWLAAGDLPTWRANLS